MHFLTRPGLREARDCNGKLDPWKQEAIVIRRSSKRSIPARRAFSHSGKVEAPTNGDEQSLKVGQLESLPLSVINVFMHSKLRCSGTPGRSPLCGGLPAVSVGAAATPTVHSAARIRLRESSAFFLFTRIPSFLPQ